MNRLSAAATKSSPEMDFDPDSGILAVSGASYPENAFAFYKPFIDWLKEYIQNPAPSTDLRIDLKYLNTSSTKSLMNMLGILEDMPGSASSARVTWYHDASDDSMRETGEEFAEASALPFKVTPRG